MFIALLVFSAFNALAAYGNLKDANPRFFAAGVNIGVAILSVAVALTP